MSGGFIEYGNSIIGGLSRKRPYKMKLHQIHDLEYPNHRTHTHKEVKSIPESQVEKTLSSLHLKRKQLLLKKQINKVVLVIISLILSGLILFITFQLIGKFFL